MTYTGTITFNGIVNMGAPTLPGQVTVAWSDTDYFDSALNIQGAGTPIGNVLISSGSTTTWLGTQGPAGLGVGGKTQAAITATNELWGLFEGKGMATDGTASTSTAPWTDLGTVTEAIGWGSGISGSAAGYADGYSVNPMGTKFGGLAANAVATPYFTFGGTGVTLAELEANASGYFSAATVADAIADGWTTGTVGGLLIAGDTSAPDPYSTAGALATHEDSQAVGATLTLIDSAGKGTTYVDDKYTGAPHVSTLVASDYVQQGNVTYISPGSGNDIEAGGDDATTLVLPGSGNTVNIGGLGSQYLFGSTSTFHSGLGTSATAFHVEMLNAAYLTWATTFTGSANPNFGGTVWADYSNAGAVGETVIMSQYRAAVIAGTTLSNGDGGGGGGEAAGDEYAGIVNVVGSATGNDVIFGSDVGSAIVVGSGADTVFLGQGVYDAAFGMTGSGPGNVVTGDTAASGANGDTIEGDPYTGGTGAGNNTIAVGAATNTGTFVVNLGGFSGTNKVTVLSKGAITVDGGSGSNTITVGYVTGTGAIKVDTAAGGVNTIKIAGTGADTIVLGATANTVTSGGGAATVTGGGAGADTVTVGATTSSAAESINLSASTGTNKLETLGTGVDTITLGTGASTVTADGAATVKGGGAGNVSVTAGSLTSSAAESIDLSATSGSNTIKALSSGKDTITLGSGANTVTADGTATVTGGGAGNDSITAGTATSTANESIDASATSGTNTLKALGTGTETITSGSGKTTVTLTATSTGGATVDLSNSNVAGDAASLNDGADGITLGTGGTTVTLGTGTDTVTLTGKGGLDTLKDWHGSDTIDLSAISGSLTYTHTGTAGGTVVVTENSPTDTIVTIKVYLTTGTVAQEILVDGSSAQLAGLMSGSSNFVLTGERSLGSTSSHSGGGSVSSFASSAAALGGGGSGGSTHFAALGHVLTPLVVAPHTAAV